jgi:NADPH:quinone reductase
MRVVGSTEWGGPEVLGIHDVPAPHAGPGEVRIAVRAMAVSPTDEVYRLGTQGDGGRPAPHVPGMDAAGVIDEIGPGVEGWNIGDAVMAMALPLGMRGGAYVERLAAPLGSFTRIPDGVSFAEASTVPMNGLTALQALRLAGLAPGATIAVTGAAGVLGGYVVQLALEAGLTVVADAADPDVALVRKLGAEIVVARGDGLAARIRAAVPNGVDAVVDTAMLHEAALPAVRDGGVFVAVRGWTGPTAGERGIRFAATSVSDEYGNAAALEHLASAVTRGALTPRVADVCSAGRAPDVHRRMAAGGVRGRLVLSW